MDGLEIVPITLRQAYAFVESHHRHHGTPRGHKVSIGVQLGDSLVGIAIMGRPVARNLDDGRTIEVTRTCTDGTPNANSMLYGAAWRTARAMGYRRLITYTQEGETGASLRAAGLRITAEFLSEPSWSRNGRPREARPERVRRYRWEITDSNKQAR